jgi:hypothetical protein
LYGNTKKVMQIKEVEDYLNNLFKKTSYNRLADNKVRTKIIGLIKKGSEITNLTVSDLLLKLDFKPNDLTIETLEGFLAELRSIFWLQSFKFTDIQPLSADKKPAPDFIAKYKNNICAIEVFCLTQTHEQQKDSTLNCYVNFDPQFNGSKFGRDFMSKAIDKKKQLDSNNAKMKILLCIINSNPIISLNTAEEIDKHAEFLYNQLNWGNNYYVGILTGAEVNGKPSDIIYPIIS